MAKITNPVRFSDQYGFDPKLLKRAGVLNPTLNVDTRLFIDPLLLSASRHHEIRTNAVATYDDHFTTVIKLLRASTKVGDVAWRNASRYLSFPEIKWTCLGYGAHSVSGSGSTPGRIIETAKQIVDLGVDDPKLFVAMALFEEGFGPDNISDMTANVILGDLLRFNARVLKRLPVKSEPFTLQLRNGKTYHADLPLNPFVSHHQPVILVLSDVLRDLPIVKDWSDVAQAASQNEQLRQRVNYQIADLWAAKTLKDKAEVRRWALSGKRSSVNFWK